MSTTEQQESAVPGYEGDLQAVDELSDVIRSESDRETVATWRRQAAKDRAEAEDPHGERALLVDLAGTVATRAEVASMRGQDRMGTYRNGGGRA